MTVFNVEAGAAKDGVSPLLHAADARIERMRVSDNTGRTKFVGDAGPSPAPWSPTAATPSPSPSPPAGDGDVPKAKAGSPAPQPEPSAKKQRRRKARGRGGGVTPTPPIAAAAAGCGGGAESGAAAADCPACGCDDGVAVPSPSTANALDLSGWPEAARRDAVLRLSCPERARVFGDWIVEQYPDADAAEVGAGARAGRVTLDVAGGKGELALILTLAGRKCVLVDPRESSLKRRQRKQLRRSGREMIETERVEFGTNHPESVEATARLSKLAGLIVGLHPDQAAGAIVETAIAKQVPFAVIPCCVFARLFPDRAVDGVNVTTNSLLCLWLMYGGL